jgi:O-antigen/teichoic acid export membrane protein
VGAVGLIVGEVLGRVGGITSLAAFAVRKDRHLLGTVSTKKLKQAAHRFRRFPLLSGPSALLNKASLKLPELLFASLFMPSVAGWFALAQRVISVPSWLVSQAIHQVYLGEASEMARNDPGELKALFVKVSGLLAVVGVLPALVLWGFGGTLFPFVFGENWVEAGLYAESMSFALFGQIVVSPLSMTLNVLERQDLQLAWDAVRFTVVAGLLGGGSLWGLTAGTTVLLYSLGLCLTYGLLWVLCLYAIRQQQMAVSANKS